MRITLNELLAALKSKCSARNDLGRAEIRVQRWRLEKFDGDPPKPGEHKQPVEVVEGGDGLPTVVRRRDSFGNLVPIGKE